MKSPAIRRGMPRRWVGWLMAWSIILPVLAGTTTARADEGFKNDIRLEGYGPAGEKSKVVLDTGNGTNYLLFGLLLVLCVIVLFKDAKRSHIK